jgi:hypothetical protein
MGAIGSTERRAVERVFDGGTRDEAGVLDNIGTVRPKAEHFLSTSLIIYHIIIIESSFTSAWSLSAMADLHRAFLP